MSKMDVVEIKWRSWKWPTSGTFDLSKKLFDLPHAFCLHSRESFESASGHPSSPMLPNIQVLTLTDSDTPHVLEHGDQLFHEAQRAHGNPPQGWVSTCSPFGHESDPILAPLHWRFRIFEMLATDNFNISSRWTHF